MNKKPARGGESVVKKKPFSEIPYLKGSRVELRPLTLFDAPALAGLTEDPEV